MYKKEKTNRPAADELADIREQIKALETREQELREIMIADPSERMGFEYLVTVDVKAASRLDRKVLDAKFGRAAVLKCYRDKKAVYVNVHKLVFKN